MYKKQTYESIKERILSNMDIPIDKREGSFLNDMISPLGVELTKTYIEFDNILDIAFVKSNYDKFLDLKCSEWGIVRKEGKKSIGEITFYGTDGCVVTNGIECISNNGLSFITLEEGVIRNGKVTLSAESLSEGAEYNVTSNLITTLVYTVIGVDSLTNETAFSGGIDSETDEELIERFLLKVRTPAISGNIYHYIEWATSINGVKNARIIPLYDGPGTVKVIISDENNRPVSKSVIDECRNYIESVRPIGAEVTVVTPGIFDVNIQLSLTISQDYSLESIIENIKLDIENHLIRCEGKIVYTKIGSIISNVKGVNDYSKLLINNSNLNITVSNDFSAQLNNLEVTGGS